MVISLRPDHVKRYKDIATLLVKHGRTALRARDTQAGEPALTSAEEVAADARALADDLESLGPTFIKLAQLLSTRADLLPPAYIEALSRLQDDVEALPFETVTSIIEDELGVRVSKAFAEFDAEPLAAASLGQVHRARMRSGRAVAVKVQRPDLRSQIVKDLDAIESIAAMADRHSEVGRRMGFEPMVQEFRRSMLNELDYRREARNLATLHANLEGFDRIVVPRPVDDFTTERVLTMDFVGGRKVTSLGPLARLELEGAQLAEQLFAAYLKQILVDGFFHADPHPGNVFVTDDGRLALVDLGMVARVTAPLREQLLRLLLAVGEGDGEGAAKVLANLGERRRDVEFDEAGFTRRVADMVADQHGATLGQQSAGAVITELVQIGGDCGLRPVPELTMLGRALLNLDEVSRTLDPDFRPDAAIREHVADQMRRNMLSSLSPGNVLSATMDAREFVERLPARVNKVMEALAEGQLTLRIEGIDENTLMRNIRKVANRITMGLVLAALIIGAAMMMRVPTSARLFGYPAFAIVCFVLAACAAAALLAAIAWDRRDG